MLYHIYQEKLIKVLADIRDQLPEDTKLIQIITRDSVHAAYGWIVARPILANGSSWCFNSFRNGMFSIDGSACSFILVL